MPCANPLIFRHHKSHRNVPRLNLKAIRCHEALRYALQNHIAAHSRFRINKRIPTPLHQAPQSYKIFLCSQSVGPYLNEDFLRAAQPLNLPRLGPESRTVRVSVLEPSTLRLDITDGPYLRSEPSMLMLHIADSSGTLLRFISHNSNNRQASGPHPEPGAALSDCSRRRCFRGH